MQNNAIAMAVLRLSLPSPDSDLATVMPMSLFLFSLLQLILIIIALAIKDRVMAGRARARYQRVLSDSGSDVGQIKDSGMPDSGQRVSDDGSHVGHIKESAHASVSRANSNATDVTVISGDDARETDPIATWVRHFYGGIEPSRLI